jgi:hypothetical protein
MCRDNRGHNYKELERRDAIKETVDDFIGEIIEIGLFKEDISYIFRYLKLELERIDTEDVLEINDSIETNEFLEFLRRMGKNMQNKM